MKKTDLFYIRFMDDWVVIAPTRWKLRKAVAKVNRVLASLLLEKHPDKTFIGKAMRGFTFLGYFLTPLAISVAQSAVDNMKQRIARLYEQGAGMTDIGRYVVRWLRWGRSGLNIRGHSLIVSTLTNVLNLHLFWSFEHHVGGSAASFFPLFFPLFAHLNPPKVPNLLHTI
ncbi:MAG: hypothetical protein Q3M24_00055 [Candidatus Electrothrix aestuarii]|uniref:Reverse transcriptase domain-containing protein n=1 Tax=Candidatus Electrothrix aestuarii TaxID=3062594 RepID=A0AAU8LV91_9BACT|nr:hypothetical protein [Candidatus Electrothrix aestuarii]